jgi:hypothetical protein
MIHHRELSCDFFVNFDLNWYSRRPTGVFWLLIVFQWTLSNGLPAALLYSFSPLLRIESCFTWGNACFVELKTSTMWWICRGLEVKRGKLCGSEMKAIIFCGMERCYDFIRLRCYNLCVARWRSVLTCLALSLQGSRLSFELHCSL